MNGRRPRPETPTESKPATGDRVGLRGWSNDDLGLTPSAKAYLERHFPRVAPIFVADYLAEAFRETNEVASAAKRKARRGGYWAIAFGFASLLLASLTPLLVREPGGAEDLATARVLGLLVATSAVASFLIGTMTLLFGKQKQRWMLNRLWTERLRQFHFQLIVNNLACAARAAHKRDYREWNDLRDAEFTRFRDGYMRYPDDRLIELENDRGEIYVWLAPAWQKAQDDLAESELPADVVNELFAAYRDRRFEIQMTYSRLALHGGTFGAKRRSNVILGTAQFFTLVALGASVALAVLYAFGGTPHTMSVQLAATGLGVASALVVGARALADGLQASAEKERLEWYFAAAAALASLYDAAPPVQEKVEVMRDMERLSYLEMRRFFLGALGARFVM